MRELSLAIIVPRPIRAVRCDDDAAAGDGVLSEFRHAEISGLDASLTGVHRTG